MKTVSTQRILFSSIGAGFAIALTSAMMLGLDHLSGEFSFNSERSFFGGLGIIFLVSFLFQWLSGLRLNAERRLFLKEAKSIHKLVDCYATFSHWKYGTALFLTLIIGFSDYMAMEPGLSFGDFTVSYGAEYFYRFTIFLMISSWFFPLYRKFVSKPHL